MTAGKRFKRLVRQRARRTGESYVTARRALLPTPTEDPMQENDLVELELLAVRMLGPERLPTIAFQERGGTRQLSVCVGAPEAAAIAFALSQESAPPRPMTHDALKQMVDALGGRVDRVVIGHIAERSTFTADVTLALADGSERHFDWRVSDAVALAVRTDPRPAILAPSGLLDAPTPKGTAVYNLRCVCGAIVTFREDELTPDPDRPGHFTTDGTCPSCGERVQQSLPPAP